MICSPCKSILWLLGRTWTSLAILLALTVDARANDGGLAIVVNVSSSVSNISLVDVRDLYLGKVRELPGSGLVTPIDISPSDPLHDEFVEKILEKSAREFSSYWAVRIFTGRGTPPLAVSDDKVAKEWVQKHRDAIAYVRLKEVDQTIKVVLKLP